MYSLPTDFFIPKLVLEIFLSMNRYLFLAAFIILLVVSCKKKESGNPKDDLPPITHTGANTFGCLVDGKLFKPKKKIGSLSVILQCNYQYFKEQHHFLLAARNAIDNYSVAFGMLGTPIAGDTVIHYSYPGSGEMAAGCGKLIDSRPEFQTFSNSPGEFRIEYFDSFKQIISGTFWFDAVDTATGKVVQVRDGRFDVQFTY